MDATLLASFEQNGFVVVPDVLSNKEVVDIRAGLHAFLLEHGCDVNNLENTAAALQDLSSTGGAGGVLDVFWDDFKLPVLEHSGISEVMSALWAGTFASCSKAHFTHDYGPFDSSKPIAAADRICFRLPDAISATAGAKLPASKGKAKPLQRHLAPHLDCCPHNPLEPGNKWRPVQAFLALTDCLESDHGGFECCPGLHREFQSWAANRTPSAAGTSAEKSPPCLGAFTRMRPVEDADVLARFRPVPCRAGDLVLWDNRLPHSNSRFHRGLQPREAIYVSLLPPVPRNEEYAVVQLQRLRRGLPPSDFWIGKKETAPTVRCNYAFSEHGKQLLRMQQTNSDEPATGVGVHIGE